MAQKYDERYQVDDPMIKSILKRLGEKMGREMPPGYGFTLMIFSYGEGGDFFYLSSAVREDMINMLDEFKQKLKAGA